MEITSEMKKTLAVDKKNRIIKRYLQERFKEAYQDAWLDTPENYQHLAKAIDFFYELDDDNLALTMIGSDNESTILTYKEHFAKVAALLDKFVAFSEEIPPTATRFYEKEAILEGIKIRQHFESRSLRDLHAQGSNLGIAEKFLNAELGQGEWLGEVDLERALTKLGVRDRVHITRLNAEDIGMILHFEREKHGASQEPYTIPLLINCGSSGSLRSQGSHWTEALIHVNPATGTITVDYRDSMPVSPQVRTILNNAIHYNATSVVNDVERQYTAFPDVTDENLTINVVSDDSQEDGWSCGYRSLHNLLRHPNFPTTGIATDAPPWSTFVNAPYESISLRNAIYQLLLENLQIDEDFFDAMHLDKEAFKHLEDSENYGLDEEFAKRYMELLSNKPSVSTITTEHFAKEYTTLMEELSKIKVTTDRKSTVEQLKANIAKVTTSITLSSDAKIFALLDVIAIEYNAILGSSGGANSKLGKALFKFCDEQLGVTLSKGPSFHFKKDGLLLQMMTQLGKLPLKEEEDVLPSPKVVSSESTKISKSAPELRTPKTESPTISPSVNRIGSSVDPSQLKLLKKQDLSRIGTMFGDSQFCYGGKPGGVEPGFRAIDLDEAFFEQLLKIVPPEEATGDEVDAYKTLLKAIARIESQSGEPSQKLNDKRIAFATFVNVYAPNPHAPKELSPTMSWLCEQIKGAVSRNEKLSAWMYKLDYAESGAAKERKKANKEALREFVGTRLAGIFSDKNQRQEITWIRGPSGPHALLACGWKNGLRELKEFLHGGGEPDYNGVLVEDLEAPVKRAKHVPGLGRNLIFGIAIGDRDGIGKEGQNKGFAGNAFYGFDYGKPYEGDGVCGSLRDDFTFTNPGAKAPEFMRGSGTFGFARHIMYRNYSIFYDTPLSERMIGVHILKKMITGENPSEEVLKSYPGLRQELYRIQANTPTTENLLNRLGQIRRECPEDSPIEGLIDNLSMQVSTGKLSPFDLYFAEIKMDLIAQAQKTGMDFDELVDHLKTIDKWAAKATVSNQQILDVFAQRLLLTKDEINFLDKMEKIVSPTTVMSPDGEAFLNQMQITKPSERIPFQLTKLENGSYTLTTTNKAIQSDLNERFGVEFKVTEKGLSCNLSQEELAKLMVSVDKQYEVKRQDLLTEPTFRLITLPALKSSYTKETLPRLNALLSDKIPEQAGLLEFLWRPNTGLSLRLTAKTESQVQMIQETFGLKTTPTMNVPLIIEIPPGKLQACQQAINLTHQKTLGTVVILPPSSKWEKLHESIQSPKEEVDEELNETQQLIKRFEAFTTINEETRGLITTAIAEMSPIDVSQLLSYNDATLTNKANIQHILNEEVDKIVVIAQEIELQSVSNVSSNPGSDMTTSYL
ncbi:hypothetical protein [Legionella brunensis]|uniref:Uncharacterized protein n=1 Tax=Legionella brunensis TaxID=29422 RepID=A0A0W0S030_9GAMM|nr:hypothetical protein [Legionella brunensis]KTC76828.1 hypothetical protein Lbru_2935 [Legionella brunensis]